MKVGKKKAFSLVSIVEYLFILSIILTGDTMYGVMDSFYNRGITSYTFRIFSMIMSVVIIIVYLIHYKCTFEKMQLFIIFCAIIYYIIYLLATRVRVASCLEGQIIPSFLFLVICGIKKPNKAFVRYIDIFSNLMVIIAAISLVFYFFGTVTGIIPGTSMQYYNNGWWYQGNNFFNLYFTNEWQTQYIFGHTFVRNIGIFMEAPGFAYPLTISLWWCLFSGKNNKMKIIILGVAMITTFSSKAYIFGIIVVFLYLYSKASDNNKLWKRIRYAVLPIAIILVVGIVFYVMEVKIATSSGGGSFTIRMADTIAAWRTWLDYPLFGAGYFNIQAIYEHYPIAYLNGNPTAGLINILAYGGIYMFAMYTVGILSLKIRSKNDSSFVMTSFIIVFFAFLLISGNQYGYFNLLILALGWSTWGKKYDVEQAINKTADSHAWKAKN